MKNFYCFYLKYVEYNKGGPSILNHYKWWCRIETQYFYINYKISCFLNMKTKINKVMGKDNI